MSWFSEYVGDPLKALLAKALAEGTADLKALAGQVASTMSSAPISATTETNFETAIQTGFDALVTDVVGPVPVVGAYLEPAAIAAGAAAIDYGVEKGAAALNALGATAKAKLTALAAPATKATAATGVEPGQVAAA
jgi:hypothetical protein